MLILLTRYKLCAVQIRHIISISEDVQYKQVNHQVFHTEGHYSEILSSGSIITLTNISSKNQLNLKYHSKLLVFNICHIEIIICIRKFTILNILGGIPCQEI